MAVALQEAAKQRIGFGVFTVAAQPIERVEFTSKRILLHLHDCKFVNTADQYELVIRSSIALINRGYRLFKNTWGSRPRAMRVGAAISDGLREGGVKEQLFSAPAAKNCAWIVKICVRTPFFSPLTLFRPGAELSAKVSYGVH